ncbi:hypothetical protein FB45DRAFT_1024106 [Roridomyces roridus]|uniref:RRM domain-containing protein n=1 Tax=Roridomyces roridus TaxID=1738132 RepID=A0AAD7FVJ7_9AGAR|nr:hypothetical protein FB45DRAFT_1024106 [Roridomyces roridus]
MPFPTLTPTQPDEGFLNKSLLDQLDAQADAEPVPSSASDDDDIASPTLPYHNPTDPLASKMPGFYPRASFSSFANATRPPQRPTYREPPSATANQFYPSGQDSYTLTSPVLQPFDPRASFDFKPSNSIYPLDYPPPQQPQSQQPQQPQQKLNGYAAPYINGSGVMHSQTPYGPHVPANLPMNGGSLPPPAMMGPMGSMQEDISTIFVVGFPEDMQEREFQNMFTFSPGFEAATLKIPNKEYTAYGLPLSASQSTGQRGGYNAYAGSNDPYNLVTVNQGGVVVDAGRDGIASWPAAPSAPSDPDNQPASQQQQSQFALGGNPAVPRKQIIGFAKFRTREEALGARDVLQGRRVDIDKGAVLKAEMAKKNLHTKRGVGPVGGGAGGMGMNGAGPSINGMGGPGMMGEMYADALGPREREPSALGGIGLPPTNSNAGGINGAGNLNSNPPGLTNGRMAQWRNETQMTLALEEDEQAMMHEEQRERERERRQGMLAAMGLRGARERAEEERRERDAQGIVETDRARRRERERRVGAAFDAFSAIPRDRERERESQPPPAQRHEEGDYVQGPWDGVRLGGGIQTTSRRTPSPPDSNNGTYALVNGGVPFSGEAPRAFSSPPPGEFAHGLPPAHYVPLGYAQGPQYPPFMPETFTPEQQQQQYSQQHRQAHSESSTSESNSDIERGMARLAVRNASAAVVVNGAASPNTPIAIPTSNNANSSSGNGNSGSPPGNSNGTNGGSPPGSNSGSPQLASPASSGRAVDQNPPINTLYVGNLPVLPAPGSPGLTIEHLEGALRELFGTCPGYRQMSFRPKGNGPMCFVEFETVSHATKTLNELYGNTLNGLIKGGGIRLSYSKNPFGVRTPTSASAVGATLQQQQGNMAAAEAAFHQRLTSPPPGPQEPSYGAAPRFFNAAAPEPTWPRRWETVGVPRAVVSPGLGSGSVVGNGTSSTFSPFSHSPTTAEQPAAESEAQ